MRSATDACAIRDSSALFGPRRRTGAWHMERGREARPCWKAARMRSASVGFVSPARRILEAGRRMSVVTLGIGMAPAIAIQYGVRGNLNTLVSTTRNGVVGGGDRRRSRIRCVVLPFETTRWSLVLAAAGNDSQAARDALSSLCQTYWYPLYAYLRRRGLDPEDARDLTQGFLTSLIERQDFEGLRQDRGRFRAFLLASLKHYLSNWSAHERTPTGLTSGVLDSAHRGSSRFWTGPLSSRRCPVPCAADLLLPPGRRGARRRRRDTDWRLLGPDPHRAAAVPRAAPRARVRVRLSGR
jgi:hypothetical protein